MFADIPVDTFLPRCCVECLLTAAASGGILVSLLILLCLQATRHVVKQQYRAQHRVKSHTCHVTTAVEAPQQKLNELVHQGIT